MAYVQAKCKECGGILAVDDCQETSVCPFCEEEFDVKEAIKEYYFPHDEKHKTIDDETLDTDYIIVNGTLKS